MVFYLTAAVIAPIFGAYGIAVFLAASTIAFHTIQMPWYFSNLAMYHPEFLAGVLAFMTRPKLAKLGFWLPFSIGIAGLSCSVAVWGGRYFVPIALFFFDLGFFKHSRQAIRLVEICKRDRGRFILHLFDSPAGVPCRVRTC